MPDTFDRVVTPNPDTHKAYDRALRLATKTIKRHLDGNSQKATAKKTRAHMSTAKSIDEAMALIKAGVDFKYYSIHNRFDGDEQVRALGKEAGVLIFATQAGYDVQSLSLGGKLVVEFRKK